MGREQLGARFIAHEGRRVESDQSDSSTNEFVGKSKNEILETFGKYKGHIKPTGENMMNDSSGSETEVAGGEKKEKVRAVKDGPKLDPEKIFRRPDESRQSHGFGSSSFGKPNRKKI